MKHGVDYCLSLSLYFNSHFSRWTWVSRYQNFSIFDFIGAKGDGGRGGNWSYRQKSNRYHQQTNTQLFTVQMPLLSPI